MTILASFSRCILVIAFFGEKIGQAGIIDPSQVGLYTGPNGPAPFSLPPYLPGPPGLSGVVLKRAGKTYDCGETMRQAIVGKTKIMETPNYPKKITSGVNCVIKIKADVGDRIILRWLGFVLDGCHEGNKIRIGDGDQQQFHCGDKRPPTYVSTTHEVEIAIAVVGMNQANRGIIYRFTYEAKRTANSKPQFKNLISKFDKSNRGPTSRPITNQQTQGNQQNSQGQNKQQGQGKQQGPGQQQGQGKPQSSQGQKTGPNQGQNRGQGQNQQNSQGQNQQDTQGQYIPQAPQGQNQVPIIIPTRSPYSKPPMNTPRNFGLTPNLVPLMNSEQQYREDKILEYEEELEKELSSVAPIAGLVVSIICIIIPLVFILKFVVEFFNKKAGKSIST